MEKIQVPNSYWNRLSLYLKVPEVFASDLSFLNSIPCCFSFSPKLFLKLVNFCFNFASRNFTLVNCDSCSSEAKPDIAQSEPEGNSESLLSSFLSMSDSVDMLERKCEYCLAKRFTWIGKHSVNLSYIGRTQSPWDY